MADVMEHGFKRDSVTGALAVTGPLGVPALAQPLGRLIKADAPFSGNANTVADAAYKDVTGLTGLVVTCPALIEVRFSFSKLSNDLAGGIAAWKVQMDGADLLAPDAAVNPQVILDCMGRTVVAVAPGVHTFKVQIGRTAFGASNGQVTLTAGALFPAILDVLPG